MKKTPLLRDLLEQNKTKISESDFNELVAESERLISVFVNSFSEVPSGAARAAKVHALIEEQNRKFSAPKISCEKGCGFCCHLEVEITEDDAELLANSILSKNLKIDEDLLLQQASRERLDKAWKRGFVAENRCVMLDETNSCRSYEERPSTCRKHAVVSPARECGPRKGSPVPVIIPMSEIIHSAHVNLAGNGVGSLPRLLVRALKRREAVSRIEHLNFIEEDDVEQIDASMKATGDSIIVL